jgi:hypothetical protein
MHRDCAVIERVRLESADATQHLRCNNISNTMQGRPVVRSHHNVTDFLAAAKRTHGLTASHNAVSKCN